MLCIDRKETNHIVHELEKLKTLFKGDIFLDKITGFLYATDASVYREVPAAVTRPANKEDIIKLIRIAQREKIPLIPRTAGTSLAGQVVGNGVVVDVSKYMTAIIEVNQQEQWVRVEPGVVLDELNQYLEQFGLFFGPETSTSNRCMIGGMVGNNSCGTHSLIYGSTRDHVISLNVILSDGSEVEFGPLTRDEFQKKCEGKSLENKIYWNIKDILSKKSNQEEIRKQFPDKKIKRRNTGYAIDLLMDTEPFSSSTAPFNFCTILAGSEGTLAFITEIKLNLIPLPPKAIGLICVHFQSLENALYGNLIALKYKPGAIELMDHVVLEQTKKNIAQQRNRFFLKGDPAAILMIEFARESEKEIKLISEKLEEEMRSKELGYHFPLILGQDILKAWALRKAGLGVLSNIRGDAKPVAVIEDTCVFPENLPGYIKDFQHLLVKYGLECVYYAHIATGELHLRPVLNLKDKEHVAIFRNLALETARLVKKQRGSLSGEHGDGRLRGEFIPLMIGDKNYSLLRGIKKTWDPQNIFNPGKIIDTPAMNTSLRYQPGKITREIDTIFDFSANHGITRAVEQCVGSGDCRKSSQMGGVMCPSFMASMDEDKSTRARANLLREFLTNSSKNDPFNHKEIYDIMDLCLSCKGCKSECPANVDITKFKAEFLQHYYDHHWMSLRTRLIAYSSKINKIASHVPSIYNFIVGNKTTSYLIKKLFGFAPKRTLPLIYKISLKKWALDNLSNDGAGKNGNVFFFADEFTDYNDTNIGIKAINLLQHLGYRVIIPRHIESGRALLSKGLVRKAQKIATKNINLLSGIISEETPLIGIEPSAILTFRDEYRDLASPELKDAASKLARYSYMIDEFLANEIKKGKITKDQFTRDTKMIRFHGHCYQKSLVSTTPTKAILSFPENYHVEEIKSGCCGMAGSFGLEKEHYDLSMQIGELILFPEIRKSPENTVIAAPGTSCRQQIKDGTGRLVYHPVEILYDALV